MKRSLFSLLMIGSLASVAIAATGAFFSDLEVSQNNVLAAGAIDLKIDNTSYYNGVFNQDTSWSIDDLTNHLFFDFDDLKPGDIGEDTISIHVDTNDAWACFDLTLTKDDDGTCTEPELLDDPACQPDNGQDFDGELGSQLQFVFWIDDGDNVLEADEEAHILAQGPALDMPASMSGALADSETNRVGGTAGDPLTGGTTYYIAKAWCFGDMTIDPVDQDGDGFLGEEGANGPDVRTDSITCNGDLVDNSGQTDLLMGDLSFEATQERHQPDFLCGGVRPSPTPTNSPSPTPTDSPSPTPVACIDNADVMLVLDRSGSINSIELAQLKTAGKAFVDALAPSVLGAHVGSTSFATTGSLDQALTSSGPAVKAAINGLASGGFTNLLSGLQFASAELSGVNDRPDATVPDYYVLITDGNPNRPLPELTAPAAAAAQAASIKANPNAKIYVVGVGNDVDANYLQNTIASTPGDYYAIGNFSQLSSVLQGLVENCNPQ